MRNKVWLSVDWDFFVRELEEWDWAHRESAFYRGMVWQVRETNGLMQGVDFREETDPNTHSNPKPLEFWSHLEELGYDFTGADVFVTDSHAYGSPVFMNRKARADRIVHFDAHHDLGYKAETIKKNIENETSDCGDWQFHVLQHYQKLRSLIVYPAWKGSMEWDETWGSDQVYKIVNAGGSLFKRVKHVVGVDNEVVRAAAGKVDAIHICRSGAWSPPWLDQMFVDFVDVLGEHTFTAPMTPFEDEEGLSPLKPREYTFDPDSMKEPLRVQQEALEALIRENSRNEEE